MKRQLWWCLLLILIWPRPVLSQLPGNATLVLFPGAPTGNCNSRQLALDQSNGSLYTCINAAATNQGTWQIVAGGGGGGGGWNPPAVGGDTIFGNNTVGTSVPSFFIPGGDVSFSAGSFSVNNLHFGPTSLALTNTGIATGNCLQVSGSNIIGGACGTGGSGGLSGSGTVNLIPKFTAATALGNSLLTDNGTTLTYTGSGGIVAPKISITQGPLQFTSVTGSLPSPPAVGNNSLVSGTDGWYVSNNGGAFLGPLGAGGSVTAGVSSFGTPPRTGAVVPVAGDYTVTQVTGAAPLANPAFTGTPTAGPSGSIPANDSSTRLATTEWVKANFTASGGGGGGQAIPIGPSAQTPTCVSNDTATNTTLSNIPVTITAADTVLVTVSNPNTVVATTATITDNASGGSNVYGNIYTRSQAISGNVTTVQLFGTTPGTAKAATSLTVTQSQASRFVVCVAAYVGVNAYGPSPYYVQTASVANANTNMTLATNDNNGYVFVVSSFPGAVTASSSTGSILTQHSSTTPQGISSAICEGTSPTPAPAVGCNITWNNSNTAIAIAVAVELRPGVTTAALYPGPKVVAYHKANVVATTTAATDTAFMTCSTTDCPPGYYRITWDFLSLGSGCTNGQVIVNVDYYDEYDLTTPYHTGIGSLSNIGPGRNHAYWVRMMTVAKPFNSTVGIQLTTSTTACSSGTGTAQQTVSVERLQ